MAFKLFIFVGIMALAAIIFPLVLPKIVSDKTTSTPDTTSSNSLGHERWTDGFDINTDWGRSWPKTGVTRTYNFTITEIDQFIGGDGGVKEKAMLVNGQFPGPVIQADWGDMINVTIFNGLRTNGTSIHWHGFRQLNNNINDGTAAVTECPIPPGGNKTYSFQATQYGTSWYHSHISSQYANGILGPIQINGPSSYGYDIDLGVFPISDWYYSTADVILNRVFNPLNPFVSGLPGSPPASDNLLFNGSNINPTNTSTGRYSKVVFTPGKRHLLRLINTSADNTFTISIVGHSMTVIATDFVPVYPYPVTSVYLSVGQRLDVVIDANQPVDTYWLNATFSSTGVCGSSNNPHPAAIVQYEGAPWWIPGNEGVSPRDSYCADDITPIPVVSRNPPATSFSADPIDTINVSLEVNTTVSKVYWQVNGSSIDSNWSRPTLQHVLDGDSVFHSSSNVIELPYDNEWSFWLIQNVSPIPHPMHLHGHDFVIIGRSEALPNPLDPMNGPTPYNPATDSCLLLQTPTPIRRDTTILPAYGWLVVAFETDNPGAWVFHCHIVWHVSQGLSVQFLERTDDIASSMDLKDALTDNCAAWRAYEPLDPFKKIDSGL